jgi:hypothetical protein
MVYIRLVWPVKLWAEGRKGDINPNITCWTSFSPPPFAPRRPLESCSRFRGLRGKRCCFGISFSLIIDRRSNSVKTPKPGRVAFPVHIFHLHCLILSASRPYQPLQIAWVLPQRALLPCGSVTPPKSTPHFTKVHLLASNHGILSYTVHSFLHLPLPFPPFSFLSNSTNSSCLFLRSTIEWPEAHDRSISKLRGNRNPVANVKAGLASACLIRARGEHQCRGLIAFQRASADAVNNRVIRIFLGKLCNIEEYLAKAAERRRQNPSAWHMDR